MRGFATGVGSKADTGARPVVTVPAWRASPVARCPVTGPGGKAGIRLPIPNLVGLKGKSLYLQALVLHSVNVAGWRLTNRIVDLIH